MSERATTIISTGTLVGVRDAGIDRYLGVPYAAAPVGDARFGAPRPAPAWTGERDATVHGPTAPQNPYGPATAPLLANVIDPGDDYLHGNVWAPVGGRGRPVIVWVHGGSFANGSNALDGYDGTAFARDGVVFVAINYRLGAEGFAVLDGVPRNLGLEDVAAAFRWVRAEIAAFGGDPANVTAVGESAGAMAIGALLALPAAGDLFDRVVLESGAPTAAKERAAGRITRLIAKRLRVGTDRGAFAAVPSADLLAATRAVTAGSNPLIGGLSWGPVIGGVLVPADPLERIVAGAGDSIPMLVGWTTEEYRLWFVPSGLIDRIGRALFAAARVRFRIGPRVLRAYRAAHPGAGRGELFGTLAQDLILRLPYRRVFEARRARGAAPTFVYEFAWRTRVADLGASHVLEIPFVFDRVGSPDWTRIIGPDAPQWLADDMHAAWVRFATTGDPGWRAWDASKPTMVFGPAASTLVEAPREAEIAAWRR